MMRMIIGGPPPTTQGSKLADIAKVGIAAGVIMIVICTHFAKDDPLGTKIGLCAAVGGVASILIALVVKSPTPVLKTAAASRRVKERLEELDDLRLSGTITSQEWASKREEILRQL